MTELDPTQLVAALGDTATEIARTLANKGITGKREDPERCPIANYLTEQGFRGVTVDRDTIIVNGDNERGEYVMTPAGLAFVALFDLDLGGRTFPELAAPVTVDEF